MKGVAVRDTLYLLNSWSLTQPEGGACSNAGGTVTMACFSVCSSVVRSSSYEFRAQILNISRTGSIFAHSASTSCVQATSVNTPTVACRAAWGIGGWGAATVKLKLTRSYHYLLPTPLKVTKLGTLSSVRQILPCDCCLVGRQTLGAFYLFCHLPRRRLLLYCYWVHYP